jgi:hypothetical protein
VVRLIFMPVLAVKPVLLSQAVAAAYHCFTVAWVATRHIRGSRAVLVAMSKFWVVLVVQALSPQMWVRVDLYLLMVATGSMVGM